MVDVDAGEFRGMGGANLTSQAQFQGIPRTRSTGKRHQALAVNKLTDVTAHLREFLPRGRIGMVSTTQNISALMHPTKCKSFSRNVNARMNGRTLVPLYVITSVIISGMLTVMRTSRPQWSLKTVVYPWQADPLSHSTYLTSPLYRPPPVVP